MGNKALVPLELYTSGSNPTVPTPPEGAIYYNSTADEIRMYNGSTWAASVNTATDQTVGGVKTFSTYAVFPAATTSIPSIRLPHGAAPSAPTNGDIWTTTAGIYVRINGSTVGPLGSGGGTPASTVTTLDGLQSAVVGTGTNYARDDHKHAVTGLVATTGNQAGIAGDKSWTGTHSFGNTVYVNDSLLDVGSNSARYHIYLEGVGAGTTADPAILVDDALGSDLFMIDWRGRIQTYDSTAMTTKGNLIVGGTDGARIKTVGSNGTVLTADSADARGVTWVQNAIPLVLSAYGSLSVSTGVSRVGVEGNYTIAGIRARVNTAPTGASVIVDVNKNGTTIFSTQSNRPTIAASAFDSGYVTNMNTTTMAAGDYFTIDVDQVGSTVEGSHLTVTIWIVRTS